MSVLRTKLYIPTTPEHFVLRPSLHKRIDTKKRLTLVSASAGFGKSSLIASWLKEQQNHLSCWLSLDSADNDKIRFFSHLIAALQSQDHQIGSSIQPDMLGSVPPTGIWTILINDLIDTLRPIILVLDDYHLITSQQIHGGIQFLLENQPPTLHLILTTRVDPPLPLPRLRAKGKMTELRSADLRFSFEETGQFLNDKLHLNIDRTDLEQLQSRTEGWIASLQLAGVALLGTEQAQHELIQNFSGSDRYVMDYLLSDVLHQLSADDQLFLSQTAHLDRFCAPLCDTVRQTNDSQTYLDRLEKANLFLFPLDNQRNWYRYHHLFADLLKVHATFEPDELANYHARASQWFEQGGLIEEAVQHAFAAEDTDLASQIIIQHAHPLFSQGKVLLVYSWLDRLPPEWIKKNAELYLVYGLSLFRIGRFEALKAHLHKRPTQLNTHQTGEFIALQAYTAYIDGDFSRGIKLGKQALSMLDSDNIAVQMPVITQLGWSYEMEGQISAAIEAHTKTLPMAYAIKSYTGTVASLSKLILLHAQTGNHAQALTYYQQLTEFNSSKSEVEIALAGMAHIGYGTIKQDPTQIRQGIELCRQWGGLHIDMLRGYKCLIDLKRQQNRIDEVKDLEKEVEQAIKKGNLPSWVNKIIYPENQTKLLDPLTPREQEILTWLCRDISVPKIAKQLVVGESTVRSHIKKVYAKLDVHSRHEAVQVATELKLISPTL